MKQVYSFLNRHHVSDTSLLVAVSGGPDSMALLYMMFECPVSFGVVHIDHGWREESTFEAEELKKICEKKEVPFHLSKLDCGKRKGNLEAFCRKERQKIYKQLCNNYGYSAVLLGHHQDDLAETVLKRVFEGARLEHCNGMSEITMVDGISYWRPLLGFRKLQIIEWLKKREISYFIDYTNSDSRFLRSRLRTEILPDLSCRFGKEIAPGLAFLGKEAHCLRDFMELHSNKWLSRAETGPFGTLLDLKDDCPHHLFEARYLISELFPLASREIAYLAAKDLLSNALDKRYEAGGRVLYIDRKRVFLSGGKLPDLQMVEVPLKVKGSIGCWSYKLELNSCQNVINDWKHVLSGTLCIPFYGEINGCCIGMPPPGSGARKTLKKRRAGKQTPSFIRNLVPAVWRCDEIVCDFLDRSEEGGFSEKGRSLVLSAEANSKICKVETIH